MSDIQNYTTLDDLGSYDKALNPKRLSVLELLPTGVSWIHNGNKIEIHDSNKIVALLLSNGNEVALIKAPYDRDKNNAYIVDAEGKVKWDIKSMFGQKIRDAIFYDVYYITGELHFFININNCDYRFSFDTETGVCGNLLQSY